MRLLKKLSAKYDGMATLQYEESRMHFFGFIFIYGSVPTTLFQRATIHHNVQKCA